MIMKNDDYELNEYILRQSQINSRKLHIILFDKTWRNGYVESCDESTFIFIDDVYGKLEPMSFLEVYKVKYYTSPSEVNK